MLDIIILSTLLPICYNILIKQGELLQFWARFINMSKAPTLLKKLLLCPHCVAGQMALWQCVYYDDHYLAIPVSIILVYYFITITTNENRTYRL